MKAPIRYPQTAAGSGDMVGPGGLISSANAKPSRARGGFAFSRHKNGFTLIELLVVIAIIGLLLALLFPALTKVRESAKDTNCKSNLATVGKAITAYANDHDGELPATGFYGINPTFSRDPRNFQNSIRDYIGAAEAYSWSNDAKDRTFTSPFHCPGFKGDFGGKCYTLHKSAKNRSGDSVKPWGYIKDPYGTRSIQPQKIYNLLPTEIAIRDEPATDLPENHSNHRNALFFDLHVGMVLSLIHI